MILAYKKTPGKFTKVLGFEKTPPSPLGKNPKKSRLFFLAASLNKNPEAEKSLNVLSGSLACNGVWLDRQRTHPWPGETLRALDLDHSQRLVISG